MKELPSIYSSIIHRSRYSRYLPELQRRESWTETVDRLITYLKGKTGEVTIPYDYLRKANRKTTKATA